MKSIPKILIAVSLFAFFYLPAEAMELKMEDLSASVEVVSTFSLSLDNPNLAFGLITPGQTKILGEGRFFNQVKCRSNSGRPWYVKAQLLSLRSAQRPYSPPLSNLKWKIGQTSGSNRTVAQYDFQAFSDAPVLIYTSMGDDNRGKEVELGLQYSLALPPDAPAGEYIGQVVFTMAETP